MAETSAVPGEERELKLLARDAALLERLRSAPSLGPFAASTARLEAQSNAFFDTSAHDLARAGLSFRRRQIRGQPLAAWTVKGRGTIASGISVHPEVEVWLDADMAPTMVLALLSQAARERRNAVLGEQLRDALSGGRLVPARPYLETQTERWVRDLDAPDRGWRAELALDATTAPGHGGFREWEIEVELKQGDDAALEAAREALRAEGAVQEATATKLRRALEHVNQCPGCA